MNTKEVLADCLNDLNPKSVLDLGIGLGRCSIRFLEKGSKVTGIDIKKLELPKEIELFIQDIRNFNFKETYDLIIASLILHFFKKEESIKIINKIKNSTNKDGFNFLLCLSSLDKLSKDKEDFFYPSLNELKELYKDWKIIKFGRYETDIEIHDNLPPHRHNIIFLLCKK